MDIYLHGKVRYTKPKVHTKTLLGAKKRLANPVFDKFNF